MKTKFKGMALSLVLALALLVPVAAYASEGWMEREPQLWHVTDAADILTSSEEQALEDQAQLIEDAYGFGVYVVTLEESTGDVFDTAVYVYQEYSLGVGPGKDGLLLLLSMAERDYSLIAHGDYGNYAFTDEGREAMTEFFLDDFSNDWWYAGFADFLSAADDYLAAAAAGEPYADGNIPMETGDVLGAIGMYLLAVVLIPFVIMLIVIRVMDSKMKSVAAATEASRYVVGALLLTNSRDTFSHVTEVAVPIPKDNDGPRTSHMGGFSGTSGKF